MAGIGARRLRFRSRLSKKEKQQGGSKKHDALQTTKTKTLSSSSFTERRSGGSPNESRSPGGLRTRGSQSTDTRSSPPSSPDESAKGAAQSNHGSFLCNALGPPGLGFEEDDEQEQLNRSLSFRKLRGGGQIIEPRRTRSEPENQRTRLNRDQSAPPSALRRMSSFRRVNKVESTVEEAQPGCELFGAFHREDELPKKKEKAVRFAPTPSLRAKARLVGATAVLVAANRMNNRSRSQGKDDHESNFGQSCNGLSVEEDVSEVFCDPAFFSEVKHEVGYMLGYKPEEVQAEKKMMWM